jgi:1-deoxy-D-xylulose-5-phosphate synthase
VISIEDNGIVGGCGARLAQEMRLAEVTTPLREFGIEQRFLEHASRAELLEELRLTPQHIARFAVEAIVRGGTEPSRTSAAPA